MGKSFDIGGLSILTYKEMLYKYAKNRGLKKLIITLPIMTPRLSSYWLYFVTSTSYPLAVNLVKSMSGNDPSSIMGLPLLKLISYLEKFGINTFSS